MVQKVPNATMVFSMSKRPSAAGRQDGEGNGGGGAIEEDVDVALYPVDVMETKQRQVVSFYLVAPLKIKRSGQLHKISAIQGGGTP